jgi:hypothetical protein
MTQGRDLGWRSSDGRLDLSHLRRDARTALELAVVAPAPWTLIERLATVAGLLEALCELPPDSPPAMTLVPKVTASAKSALDEWNKWHKAHLEENLPRG